MADLKEKKQNGEIEKLIINTDYMLVSPGPNESVSRGREVKPDEKELFDALLMGYGNVAKRERGVEPEEQDADILAVLKGDKKAKKKSKKKKKKKKSKKKDKED